MRKQFKLFSLKDWICNLTINTYRDMDFHDDFHISVAWRAEGKSISGGYLTRNKYIIFEFFNRRLVEIKLTKVQRLRESS